MDTNNAHILTVNAGSSSIKLALFTLDKVPKKTLEAAIENIGQPVARFVVYGQAASAQNVAAADHLAATRILTDWLKQQSPSAAISAVGHRLVHGGPDYYQPQIINDDLLAGLRKLTLFDPEHLPIEITLINEFQKLFPDIRHVACFDTAFHHGLPTVARLLPIPRQLETKGIRRYGFHGLSYAFVLQELQRLGDPAATTGRLIIAHLGSGVSLAAIHNGVSIDTTMGLTPASGVPMSMRSGDLDPGLALYLARAEGYDAEQFNTMVNFKSGLLGISGISADMEELLGREADDAKAKDAVDLFCYQVKKSIGGLAAALGGLDTLVFTGGMGEQAPKIRARVCAGLEFLGIKVEESRNATSAQLISADDGRVAVRVIHTDESSTIAQNVWQLITNKKVVEHEVI
jgi:acetate kinase